MLHAFDPALSCTDTMPERMVRMHRPDASSSLRWRATPGAHAMTRPTALAELPVSSPHIVRTMSLGKGAADSVVNHQRRSVWLRMGDQREQRDTECRRHMTRTDHVAA